MFTTNFYDNNVLQLLTPAVKTADAVSTGIATQPNKSMFFVVNVGAAGDTFSESVKAELEIQESDDDITYTACVNADVATYDDVTVTGTNTGTFAVIDANAECGTCYKAAYIGDKKYARVKVNLTGTHTNGTIFGVSAVVEPFLKNNLPNPTA